MEVDKRSVLPRALKIDHARNPAVFRQGCTRCFVEQNRFVARFRLEFAIEVALLPRQQQYAVGLEGLVVVRVDFDGVGPRPQERRVVVAAPPGRDLAYAQFLAGLEQHQLDAGHRLPRGIHDGPAQRSRLGLREQQSRRYGKEQKSIEPENHACLTVASLRTPERHLARLTAPRRGATCGYRAELNVDRKSTRLNSSHLGISYAVFC